MSTEREEHGGILGEVYTLPPGTCPGCGGKGEIILGIPAHRPDLWPRLPCPVCAAPLTGLSRSEQWEWAETEPEPAALGREAWAGGAPGWDPWEVVALLLALALVVGACWLWGGGR